MSRTIFNELGESRVINPRSGSSMFVDISSNQTIHGIKTFDDDIYLNSNLISTGNISTTGTISGTLINNNQFVDLSNNQSINGIKRFLNNLITNSNVNFNTTAGVGRIKFFPNVSQAFINNIIEIYKVNDSDPLTGFLSFDNTALLQYKVNNISQWSLDQDGNIIALLSVNAPTINATTLLKTNTIESYTTAGSITFLSNLITNSNVNFNTTANVGRIVFKPNEPVGSGNIIMAIYRENENDGQAWIFNSVGNLYCIGSGLIPIKINFSSDGNITCIGIMQSVSINTGSITCTSLNANASGTIFTSGNFSFNTLGYVGRIVFKPNSMYGSSAKILSVYTYDENDGQGWIFDAVGNLYYISNGPTPIQTIFSNNGNISITGGIISAGINCTSLNATSGLIETTGLINGATITASSALVTNLINAKTFIGYKPSIYLDNRFIDTGNSSLDIKATYIGFASPTQTLTTASKYVYIKPLATGDFEIRINNISNKVLVTNWSQLATETQMQSAWYSTAGVLMGFINPNPPAGVSPTMRIMGTSNQYIYYNTGNNFGNYNSTTSVINWEITASGNFTTNGSITASNTLSLRNASAITNITLNATTTSGDRLLIYGVASGTKYLYYNTSNNIGVYNTSTSTSVWSIDGTTGNIVTIGSYTVASLSATSLLCNSISPLSGTIITFGITSNCNWLKSAGVNRILMYPSSTSGDIMQITRIGDTSYTSGYWYFNNSGNFGYNTGGISVWELLNTGGLSLRGTLQMVLGSIILSDTYSSNSLTDGGTYKNSIKMNTLFTATTIGSIELSSRYINFVNPYQTLDIYSKYMFILPDSGGNFTQYINNVNARVLQTDWSNLVLKTDYNFQCFGKSNYIEGSQTGNLCGHWSNRTDTLGNPVTNIGNNWVTMSGMENNNASVIGSGFPNAGSNRRVFTWLIENTNNSGKALGLACNRTNTPNSVINTLSQASGFSMMGFYAPNRGGGAYSFTGEHSSMVCDEEYDDIMNYNTDDFIGMVVCSSGKIYNLPYDCDGNTYEKQVDNIKPVDSQPMTRLSKKYKDKSVLGVICHIEKVGKNRNDLGGTSWTGCLSLDKDERRRIRVASIGEGGIWITNEYGNIENGDYITTSNIAGYSTKQDTDFLMNYTIGKATMDCDFDIEKPDEYKTKKLGNSVYASYIACTYHSG